MRYAMSQAQLSNILGITHQQVQKYETGRNRLPLEKLLLIKEHFNISYDILFEDSHIDQSNHDYQSLIHQLENMKDKKLRQKIVNIIQILSA